jgi:hypothetical protein
MIPEPEYVWYRLDGALREEAKKAFSSDRISPSLIYAHGLGKPAYQITQIAPRIFAAESLYPTLYCLSIVAPKEYYAAVPVSFDGRHEIPQGCRKLSAAEENHVLIGLFAGGHSSPAHPPIPVATTRLTALPNDFHPLRHAYIPLCTKPEAASWTPS